MLIFKNVKDIENHLKTIRKQGVTVGFTPTMGALHQGHIALIKASIKECNVSVCSIFVNPTQFNDAADYEKYPVTIEKDIAILNDAGCDILFLPSVKGIYPNGLENKKPVNFGFLARTLEGEHRPGHFDGMAQVVERLLRIVQPDKLYMGQKDYQQQLIVSQLIKIKKLPVKLVVGPTVREADGLAMSSRNVRLDAHSRQLAVEISKTLKAVKRTVKRPNADLQQIASSSMHHLMSFSKFEPEYFEIRNAATLQPPLSKKEKLVALTAVKVNGVRLIDNMLL
jgi:pantoate--beta-alanine ligase